jgi:hypothetical protein
MFQSGLARFIRRSSLPALFPALVVLFVEFQIATPTAFAATNWSAIQTAIGATGVVMPGDVLRIELARNDLNMTIDGVPVPDNQQAAVANGFVAFKEKATRYYADGALPAQESELSALEDALLKYPKIHITAIVNHLTNESPKLVWVHFEASNSNGEVLATWLAKVLETIHSPQIGVVAFPGVNNIIDPATILPPKILKLFDEGFVEQFDIIFAFYLPRPDEHEILLNKNVSAETGLGVGQSFYIQVPFSGGSNVTLNIDFALRSNELDGVQAMLRAGGFTLSSLSDHYVDESHRLYYLHASASGDGFTLGNTLFNVIQLIK